MANSISEIQLAQVRENSTNAVSVFAPSGLRAIVKEIIITNTTSETANVTIYNDDDGTTYDESTAIIWEDEIDKYMQMKIYWPVADGGSIGYKSSVANALTITVWGATITVS